MTTTTMKTVTVAVMGLRKTRMSQITGAVGGNDEKDSHLSKISPVYTDENRLQLVN